MTGLVSIPELGPALGRLILPADAPGTPSPRPSAWLTDARLALVTALFESAGAARQAIAGGDVPRAMELLGAARWEECWSDAASRVAVTVRGRIDAGLEAAARRSGFPARRLRRRMVADDEAEGIGLRLGAAGIPLAGALAALARARAVGGWSEVLVGAARALETAWFALEESAREEEAAWQSEAARIAEWHPARWPRWVAAAAVVAVTGYVGLVLGGYLPVPAPLAPAAHYWWDRVER